MNSYKWKSIFVSILSLIPVNLYAGIDERINEFLEPTSRVVSQIVFYALPIGNANVELIVIWLIIG